MPPMIYYIRVYKDKTKFDVDKYCTESKWLDAINDYKKRGVEIVAWKRYYS